MASDHEQNVNVAGKMRLTLSWPARVLAGKWHDAVRVALQTAIASALVFLLIQWWDLPHLSWGIISAVFTIQPNADSTLRSALGRFAGAVIGVGVGLGAVMLVGGEPHFLTRVILATGVAGVITGLWPSLRYTGVAAVVMALHPDPELAGAFERALVILIGSGSAAAVTLVVWPELARTRTARLVRQALQSILELLKDTMGEMEKDTRRERQVADSGFLKAFHSARSESFSLWFKPRLSSGPSLHQALLATESLWHGVIILHRVFRDEQPSMGPATQKALYPLMKKVNENACEVVQQLISGLSGKLSTISVSTDPLVDSISEARNLITDKLLQDEDASGNRALYALVFGLDQIKADLLRITGLLVRGEQSDATDGR